MLALHLLWKWGKKPGVIYNFSNFFFLFKHSLFFCGQADTQSTADVSDFERQGNISPRSLDEMDWALLQKTGTINPSLNMNLYELILGILILMHVLNEVIIQGVKVMDLGKRSKTQWLRHMGLKRHPAGAGTGTTIAPALYLHQSSRKTSAPALSGMRLRWVSSEHRMSKCYLAETVCKAVSMSWHMPPTLAPILSSFIPKMHLHCALHASVSPSLRYLPS